jgi:predicted ester cyclase
MCNIKDGLPPKVEGYSLLGIGLPATGKEVSFPGIGILRFAKGKVVERWTIVDSMTFLHQLGLV